MMSKFILPAAILLAASTLPTLSFAQDANSQDADAKISAITYQTSDPVEAEFLFEDALDMAGEATLAADKDWFRVTYREIDRKAVMRNASNNAESRYLDLGETPEGDEGRVELVAPPVEQTESSITLEFEMGSGPMPDTRHTYSTQKPST